MAKAKANEAEETAVVVQEAAELALPTDHLLGYEGMDATDISLPIAKLIQPIMLGQDEYENFKGGMLVHSLLAEQLPNTLIPLAVKDDKILFAPRDASKNLTFIEAVRKRTGVTLTAEDLKQSYICRATDNMHGDRFGACAACKMAEWDGTNKPLCTKNINVLAMFDGQDIPCVMQFANTSHKHGRTFKQAAFMSKRHLFSTRYKTLVTKKEDSGNVWYELQLKPDGAITDQAQLLELYKQYQMFMPIFQRQIDSRIIGEEAVAGATHKVEEGEEF